MYEVADEKKLYELFMERERLKADAQNYLESRQDADGNLSQKDADYFDENYLIESRLLDRRIEKEMEKPTRKPILNQPQNNLGGNANNAKFGVANAEYQRAFLNEVRGGFKNAYNTLRESQLDKGGYLLPTEFHDEIISQLREENILRQIGRVVETASDREIAIQATAPTAAFVAEGQQITLSTETFGRKTLKAYKLAAGVSVSNELLTDSFYSIEEHLQIEFGKVTEQHWNFSACYARHIFRRVHWKAQNCRRLIQ